MKLNLKAFFFFWGIFIVINILFFFQNYVGILNHLGWTEGPTIDAGSWTGRVHMLFRRHDYHFIKISGELLILLGLFFFINPKRKTYRWILYIIFMFLFIYNIYFEFYQKFYGVIPSFQNDYVLLQEVLPIFLNSLSGNTTFLYLFALVAIMVIASIFIYLIRSMLRQFILIKNHRAFKISYGALLAFSIIYVGVSSYKLKHQKIIDIQFLSPLVIQSTKLKGANKYEKITSNNFDQYLNKTLSSKPNIYLFFVESYGTVLTEAPNSKTTYLQKIDSIEKRLIKKEYSMASTYSLSPVKGGRSWLSFSSFMSGLKVENQIQYNDLIQKNFNYPNLIRLFNQKGYQTYRLSSMSNKNAHKLIPYERTNRYWSFDEWWTYWDFNYFGHHYDALGGIPDQYILGYYRDVVSQQTSKPKLLFFITMSSHAPWYPPPPIVEDWKTLNQERPGVELSLTGEEEFRYQEAVYYDLEILTQFIEQEEESSIFILVGDHQPPSLEYKISGITPLSSTPLHIISKDSTLVQGFIGEGFQDGMDIDLKSVKYIGHEDFYGIFMENLFEHN